MNNITFGDDRFGHYETVAGGAGAVSMDKSKITWSNLDVNGWKIIKLKKKIKLV